MQLDVCKAKQHAVAKPDPNDTTESSNSATPSIATASTSNESVAPSDLQLTSQLNGNAHKKQRDSSLSPQTPRTQSKCSLCQKRKAAEGCINQSCLSCCKDNNCPPHKRAREQAAWKAQVLDRTTPVQLRAAGLRARRIIDRKGFLKEPGFVYTGDTIVIWNIREYLANSKWKDDAIRKSLRRHERNEFQAAKTKRLGNSRKRFRLIIEQWLQESMKNK